LPKQCGANAKKAKADDQREESSGEPAGKQEETAEEHGACPSQDEQYTEDSTQHKSYLLADAQPIAR
jgi:hypothetical protein